MAADSLDPSVDAMGQTLQPEDPSAPEAPLEDMVGNLREWTSTGFRPYPYETNDGREGWPGRRGRTPLRGFPLRDVRGSGRLLTMGAPLNDLIMDYPLTLTHFFERTRRLFSKKSIPSADDC